MKKKFLLVLGFMLITSMMSTAYSKSTTGSEVTNAIKLYKNGNYSEEEGKMICTVLHNAEE